jgi:hypothetical protein
MLGAAARHIGFESRHLLIRLARDAAERLSKNARARASAGCTNSRLSVLQRYGEPAQRTTMQRCRRPSRQRRRRARVRPWAGHLPPSALEPFLQEKHAHQVAGSRCTHEARDGLCFCFVAGARDWRHGDARDRRSRKARDSARLRARRAHLLPRSCRRTSPRTTGRFNEAIAAPRAGVACAGWVAEPAAGPHSRSWVAGTTRSTRPSLERLVRAQVRRSASCPSRLRRPVCCTARTVPPKPGMDPQHHLG